jgi:hypothetical protein
MSKSEKRQRADVLLGIRCYPDEKQQIKDNAATGGLSVGEYLRRCALGRRITAKTDTRFMNEMLRLGGLLKHLHNEQQKTMTPELSKQFSDTLIALKTAIIAIDMDDGLLPTRRLKP